MADSLELERFVLRWLQRQLMEILGRGGAPECAFPADMPLRDLPGHINMRQLFAELRQRGVRTPQLMLSRFQIVLITTISLGLFAMSIASGLPFQQIGVAMIIGLAVWVVRLMVAQQFFARVATVHTVGELAEQLLWHNPKHFSRLAGIPLTHEQIKRIVIQLFAEMTGVDADEITEETPLIDLVG